MPTHASAALRFDNGAIGTVMMSFDIWSQDLPYLEVYGSAGRLRLPNPDNFDGDVLVKQHDDADWQQLEPVITPSGPTNHDVQWLRGMGVADLVRSITGAPHRATAELGYHVLEVLESIERSGKERSAIRLASKCERPAPVDHRTDRQSSCQLGTDQ